MVRELPLTKGYVAIVDDEDYELLSQWKWSAKVGTNTVYAYRKYRKDGKQIPVPMHRQIMGFPENLEVDHIDRNGLNNQRANLRLATHRQNAYNAKPRKNKSGYRGVTWYAPYEKWVAVIMNRGKKHFLGYFDDPAEGGRAYDEAARNLHGEFATLNFP